MVKYCFDLNLFFRVLAKSLIFSPEVVWSVNKEVRGWGLEEGRWWKQLEWTGGR